MPAHAIPLLGLVLDLCSKPLLWTQVAPAKITLPAGGLAELLLSFRPLHPGALQATIHVVDCDARQLVHALLVVAESQAPPVSRAFGVELPPSGHSSKRISFTNPFAQRRSFYLRSSQPALMKVVPAQLDLAPHEAKPIGEAAMCLMLPALDSSTM